jgi:proteasome lid subunit RPN8/RPN11
MRFDKIHVDRKAEREFRRRAVRAYPNEYMEGLWGYIRGSVIYVCAFVPMEHKGYYQHLTYKDEVLDDHEDEAREHNLEYLGTIHTHPDLLETLFSEHDLREVQNTQDAVMAICAITQEINKGKTRRVCDIAYWPAVRPFTVTYGPKAGK